MAGEPTIGDGGQGSSKTPAERRAETRRQNNERNAFQGAYATSTIDGINLAGYGSFATGTQYNKNRLANVQQAMTSPGDYLQLRMDKIDAIAQQENELWQRQYKYYVELGYPGDEARKRADNFVEQLHNIFMTELDAELPADPTAIAVKTLWRKTPAGVAGFGEKK